MLTALQALLRRSLAEPPARLFVILTTNRSGSNYLVELLNLNPVLLCFGEVFHPPASHFEPGFFAHLRRSRPELLDVTRRNRDPVAFLSDLAAEARAFAPAARAIGFKLFSDHDPRVLEHLFLTRSIRVVLLERRNLLHQYASWRIAMQTNAWRGRRADMSGETAHFVPADWRAFLRYRTGFFEEAEQRLARHRVFRLAYEDFAADEAAGRRAAAAISRFLGLPDRLSNRAVKIAKQDGRPALARFAEPDLVRATLSGTPEARFLSG